MSNTELNSKLANCESDKKRVPFDTVYAAAFLGAIKRSVHTFEALYVP